MRTEESEQTLTLRAIITIALVVVATGLIAGGLAGIISQWFYIPLLFPAGEAFIVFLGAEVLITLVKRPESAIPKKLFSIAVLSAAFITYGTYHYIDYLRLRGELSTSVQNAATEQRVSLTPQEISQAVDFFLADDTRHTGFLGGIILQANSGFSLRLFLGPRGAIVTEQAHTFQGLGVWLYWLVELGIIAGGSLMMTRDSIPQKPLNPCSICGSRRALESVGAVSPSVRDSFLSFMDTGNLEEAGKLIVSYEIGSLVYPRIDVQIEYCDQCNQGTATLRAIWEHSGGVTREVYRERTATPEELRQLLTSIPTQLT